MSSAVDTRTRAIAAGSVLMFGAGYVFELTAIAALSALVFLVAIGRMLVLDSNSRSGAD